MSEWQEVTLAGVCASVDYGYTASSSLEPVGPRFLRITDIVGPSLDWGEVPYCEIEDQTRERFRLDEGDIVVARTGATVGYGRWVSPPEPSVFASYLVRFRPSDEVNARFVGHIVESSTYKEFVKRSAGGAAQPNANAKVLGSFSFSLPDRPTQDRVVSLLQPIDDLIENNRRRIALLERMAQAIYREWFVHFRYPGHEDDELIDSPLGPIPAGWGIAHARDILDLDKGVSYKGAFLDDDGAPMVNLKCFGRDGGFRFDALKGYSGPTKAQHRVRPGDLVMANTDLTQAGMIVGRVAVVPSVPDFDELLVSHHVFAIRSRSWPLTFLAHVLSDERFRNHARSTASGTTVLGLRREDVLAYPMVDPPSALVDFFDEVADGIRRQQDVLSKSSRRLEPLRDLLLPKLVTGAIDVSRLDLDALLDETAA